MASLKYSFIWSSKAASRQTIRKPFFFFLSNNIYYNNFTVLLLLLLLQQKLTISNKIRMFSYRSNFYYSSAELSADNPKWILNVLTSILTYLKKKKNLFFSYQPADSDKRLIKKSIFFWNSKREKSRIWKRFQNETVLKPYKTTY
mgnify:CR=1 FL=1